MSRDRSLSNSKKGNIFALESSYVSLSEAPRQLQRSRNVLSTFLDDIGGLEKKERSRGPKS